MEEHGNKQYVRFSRLNRLLHATMIVSFMTLALTGMTLKFSYTGWAAFMSRLFGGYESAGTIHRFAAFVMIIVFVVHILDLFRRKSREFGSWKAMLTGPNTMLPTKKDLQELKGSLRWFIGRGPRPQFGRWTYWEKFDYFAVFWGIFVIGSTGMSLWFPEFFTHFIPGWMLNVATIIHSDEALLATGFIFTVHFFNTHLRPEKFPMDMVIFTGRMDLEEFQEDKPAEYAAEVENGTLEQRLADPYPPVVTRTIRIFATIAVLTGFSMIVWIIYAMIFAYR
jgi:cytochrome b subunit of formate dehydrogenase